MSLVQNTAPWVHKPNPKTLTQYAPSEPVYSSTTSHVAWLWQEDKVLTLCRPLVSAQGTDLRTSHKRMRALLLVSVDLSSVFNSKYTSFSSLCLSPFVFLNLVAEQVLFLINWVKQLGATFQSIPHSPHCCRSLDSFSNWFVGVKVPTITRYLARTTTSPYSHSQQNYNLQLTQQNNFQYR